MQNHRACIYTAVKITDEIRGDFAIAKPSSGFMLGEVLAVGREVAFN